VLGLAHDITEQKRAEQERNQANKKLQEYERVVEDSDEMIAVVDRDYRYLIANQAFAKSKGMDSEQLVGRLVEEVLDRQVFPDRRQTKTGRCVFKDMSFATNSGTRIRDWVGDICWCRTSR